MPPEPDLDTESIRQLDPGVTGYTEALPSADPESIRMYLAFIRANEVLNSRQGNRNAYGIPRPQYTLVRLLFFAEGNIMAQSDIARAMAVTPTYVTRLIDALEERGWVDRCINAENRRVTYARLTDLGRTACEEIVPKAAEFMMISTQYFDEKEKRTMQYLLSKLARGISAAQAAQSDADGLE